MKKLAEIKPRKIPKHIVEPFQDILGGLKSGEVLAIAVTAVKKGGYVTTAYDVGESTFALLGGVEHCKNRILASLEV